MKSIICTSYAIHLGNPKLYKELLKIVLQQKKWQNVLCKVLQLFTQPSMQSMGYYLSHIFHIQTLRILNFRKKPSKVIFFLMHRISTSSSQTSNLLSSGVGHGMTPTFRVVVLHMQCAILAETRRLNFRFR